MKIVKFPPETEKLLRQDDEFISSVNYLLESTSDTFEKSFGVVKDALQSMRNYNVSNAEVLIEVSRVIVMRYDPDRYGREAVHAFEETASLPYSN